jgi:sugar phosphate isomerase/epimerase
MDGLSISISGLAREAGLPWSDRAGSVDPRGAIAWIASLGVRAVHLDATLESIRPRQLDRSGRRDLAAILRRHELALSGLDLWIPPEHFSDSARAERAMDATIAALELSAELSTLVGAGSRAVVCVLTPSTLTNDAMERLAGAALRAGASLADHRVAPAIAPSAKPSDEPEASGTIPALSAGVDPAAALLAGLDPSRVALSLADRLVSARLSDASTIGRVAPDAPEARLDLLAYRVALRAIGFDGPLVIDLRGLASQARAASAWIDAVSKLR